LERNKNITRRDFLAGLGAFVTTQILLPSVLRGSSLPHDLEPLRFGFLTDCHAMQDLNAPAWLDQTAMLMNSMRADLIIGGGDFVDGGFHLPGKLMEPRWKLADSFLKKIKNRLEPVIGNHDFYDPLQPDGSPSVSDPRWRFKKQFGLERTYRSFEFHGYRFLILDSVRVVGGPDSYCGWIDAPQLLWLDHELSRIPQNQPIILCTHIPFKTSLKYGIGSLIGASPGRIHVLNSNQVMEKLKNRPLALILQGHLHVNERLELGGVPCITGGAVCGNWWKGPNMGTYPGLGMIEILPGSTAKGRGATVGWNYTNTPAPHRA
jgi:predicted phosphodiesterase